MNNAVMLTLHCPECRELAEVVTEAETFVCLACGFVFDEKVAAKFLARLATDRIPPAGEQLGAVTAQSAVVGRA